MLNTAHSSLHRSRLVRRLAELEISGPPVSAERFAERFGQLVDFSGLVNLSKMLGELPTPAFAPNGNSPETIREAFLKERASLVGDIVKRFVPRSGPSRYRLPTLTEFHANCMLKDVFVTAHGTNPATPNCDAAFAPYRKLYVALQAKLALASHRLRMQTAQAIAGISPVHAGLATLDRGLGEALYHRQRQSFDRIPTLLERHFTHLLDTNWRALGDHPGDSDLLPWMAPGGWIMTFCSQMRELLLAELEIRMQPVLGLIESIGEAGIDE